MRHAARSVPIAKPVQGYAIRLTLGTHPVSPYAPPIDQEATCGTAPARAPRRRSCSRAKIHALTPRQRVRVVDDIRAVALPALRHRLLLNFEGEAEQIDTDAMVKELLARRVSWTPSFISSAARGSQFRFDDFLKKLEYLHVVSKRAFAGQARADRLAPKRGRGLEFADHAAVHAGRRLPAHRLEGLQAPGPAAAPAL